MVSLLDAGLFVPANRGRKDLSKLFSLFFFLYFVPKEVGSGNIHHCKSWLKFDTCSSV